MSDKWKLELKKEPITFCGQPMFVQEWSGKVREEYEQQLEKRLNEKTVRATVAHLSLVYEDGRPIDATVEELAALPHTMLQQVYEAAGRINTITSQEVDEAKKN